MGRTWSELPEKRERGKKRSEKRMPCGGVSRRAALKERNTNTVVVY